MKIDELLESINPFVGPLEEVDLEADYPNLANPLHLVILLLRCDAETLSGGILGFIENPTGQHLSETIKMLALIGAHHTSARFKCVLHSMEKHNITWEAIAGDCKASEEYTISSFEDRHGNDISNRIGDVLDEVGSSFWGFQMFDSDFCGEDVHQCLVTYLEDKSSLLEEEILKRANRPNQAW